MAKEYKYSVPENYIVRKNEKGFTELYRRNKNGSIKKLWNQIYTDIICAKCYGRIYMASIRLGEEFYTIKGYSGKLLPYPGQG